MEHPLHILPYMILPGLFTKWLTCFGYFIIYLA